MQRLLTGFTGVINQTSANGVIIYEDKGEHRPDRSRGGLPTASSFKRHLKEFDHRNHEERIRALVSQIEEQGRKLSQKIDVAELKVYKRLISDFLDEVLQKTVILTEEADTRFMPR